MSAAASAHRFASRRPPLKRLLAGPAATVARGTPRAGGDTKRAVVALDAATFDRVAMLAALSRVSFAEAVRQLLILGLHTHQQEEPQP